MEPSSRVIRARAGFPCEEELVLALLLVGVSGSAGADGLTSAGILASGTRLRQQQFGEVCKRVERLVKCTGSQLNGRKCPLRGLMCVCGRHSLIRCLQSGHKTRHKVAQFAWRHCAKKKERSQIAPQDTQKGGSHFLLLLVPMMSPGNCVLVCKEL